MIFLLISTVFAFFAYICACFYVNEQVFAIYIGKAYKKAPSFSIEGASAG